MALTGSRVRRSLALMWRGMRSHPGMYVLAVGASGAFGALTVAVSRAVGWATDSIVVPAIAGDEAAQDRVWLGGLVLAAVALSLALSVAGRRIWAGYGYVHIQADHRTALTRQYLRLPASWHRAHPAGQLLNHTTSDTEAATGVFNPLPFALGVVVMIGVSVAMLVTIDPWLALAALAIIPVTVAVNAVYQRHMSPAVTRAQRLRGDVADAAHESFEAALLVKSLGTEGREEDRFGARTQELRAANVRVGIVRSLFDPVIQTLPALGTLLVLGVGTWRTSTGDIVPGDIVTAAYLLTMMTVPVQAFGWVLGELPRAVVGYERIAQVVDSAGALAYGDARLPRTPGQAGLAVRLADVGVDVPAISGARGGSITLLDGVDVDVEPGATVAVVGTTGSGKTTLVSLLARLSDPTRGRALLDGVDARTLADGEIPAQVAFVTQTTFIFEDTVRANVTLADEGDPGVPSDDEVWEALRLARLEDTVRELAGGLDAPLGERGANLSGGQRQRLAIARALVRNPRLLVLDDATSAVDPRVEQEILRGLADRADRADERVEPVSQAGSGAGSAAGPRPGTTVIMVAYRMSSVALADRVVHIEGGRVVDTGTHDELMTRDAGYRALATAYEVETERREKERADAAAAGALPDQRPDQRPDQLDDELEEVAR